MTGLCISLALGAPTAPSDMDVGVEPLVVEPTEDGTIEVVSGMGVITLIVTDPLEHAGTYLLDTSQLALGPVNLQAPVISGNSEPGSTLSLSHGLWAYDATHPAPSVTQQWQRNGLNIAGATGESYLIAPEDAGADIALYEQASDANGTSGMSSLVVSVPSAAGLLDITQPPSYSRNVDFTALPGGARALTRTNGGQWAATWAVDLEAGKSYRFTGSIEIKDAFSLLFIRIATEDNLDGTRLMNSNKGSGANQVVNFDSGVFFCPTSTTYYAGSLVGKASGIVIENDLTNWALEEIA